MAKALGLAEQTLHAWTKAAESGGLKGASAPKISAGQMEISRLRTELARVKMERDILTKQRRASPRNRSSPMAFEETWRLQQSAVAA